MQGIITVDRMKSAEHKSAENGISYLRLMENAGCAAAVSIQKKIDIRGRYCTVIAGKGNNGGDAFVVARKLFENEALVSVILASDLPSTEESREMLDRLLRLGVEVIPYDPANKAAIRKIDAADLIVDGIFGTGFHGEIDPSLLPLFRQINHCVAAVFSLDVPSGINAVNGQAAEDAICADFTVSFHRRKVGTFFDPARKFTGEQESVEIGIPETFGEPDAFLIEESDVFDTLKKRDPAAHKTNHGHLLSVCGSEGYAGAAVLSAMGAARIGVGLLTCASTPNVLSLVNTRLPEAMTLSLSHTDDKETDKRLLSALDGKTACLIGCGMGRGPVQKETVRQLLSEGECPTILDADGINNILTDINILKQAKAPVILTPHMGEMARLLGISVKELQQDRIEKARAFAAEYNVILVLKDSVTTVIEPGGTCFINQTGNAGLAKGGSGDLLAGMISGLCAQGYSPLKSAVCAVYLHGAAADRCAKRLSMYSMLPSDILEDLARIFAEKGL
ncbi:MAG: NAD(P)H-hydrate dehydratase [Oscillospiraceae bacterium]|nr:NAD(P)H-hydrate dehydratase [Oscillospiraceae bacterium]